MLYIKWYCQAFYVHLDMLFDENNIAVGVYGNNHVFNNFNQFYL